MAVILGNEFVEIFESIPGLDFVLAGNKIIDYLMMIMLFVMLGFFVSFLIRFTNRLITQKYKESPRLINKYIQALLDPSIQLLAYFSVFFLSTRHLIIPSQINTWIIFVGKLFLFYFIAKILVRVVSTTIGIGLVRTDATTSSGVLILFRIIIWALAVLLFLDNIGVEVSALLTGLGIGGVVIALAGQTVLSDFFSYFTIYFDRQIEIGDLIQVGDYIGTVEKLGVQNVRIRSIEGELLIFPNRDITNTRIRNYQKMRERRELTVLRLSLETTSENLRKLPNEIKQLFEDLSEIRLERCHFSKIQPDCFTFEIVYFVLSKEYNHFMEGKQEANLAIKRLLEEKKIFLAPPTHRLHLQNSD